MTNHARSVSIPPNMSSNKPRQVRIYLNEEGSELLRSASAKITDISESQLTSILVLAGLRALKTTGFKMSLPLSLTIEEPQEVMIPSSRR